MAVFNRDGQTWRTRNSHYGWHDGLPCKIVELHGDFETWRSNDTIVVQAETLRGGWVRYWLSSTDPVLRASLVSLADAWPTHTRHRRG